MSAGSWPGSRRQSTSITHEPGTTLRLRDASIIVGESVARQQRRDELAGEGVQRLRALEGDLDRRRLAEHASRGTRRTSGTSAAGGSRRASASRTGAALSSALSAVRGSDA